MTIFGGLSEVVAEHVAGGHLLVPPAARLAERRATLVSARVTHQRP
ncbi:hypothetical protein ACIBG7_42600 [Nonomuraea sp. NPDC050328]